MRRARGVTLLEVLIATTILASLTVIVSTLWAQMKQWTDETTTHGSALRLQRARSLFSGTKSPRNPQNGGFGTQWRRTWR